MSECVSTREQKGNIHYNEGGENTYFPLKITTFFGSWFSSEEEKSMKRGRCHQLLRIGNKCQNNEIINGISGQRWRPSRKTLSVEGKLLDFALFDKNTTGSPRRTVTSWTTEVVAVPCLSLPTYLLAKERARTTNFHKCELEWMTSWANTVGKKKNRCSTRNLKGVTVPAAPSSVEEASQWVTRKEFNWSMLACLRTTATKTNEILKISDWIRA